MSADVQEEQKNDTIETCGDIIYASQTLANSILKYNTDDSKEVSLNDGILRSLDADFAIKLSFTNESDKDLYLYWINYEGDIRESPDSIGANSTHQINSFISHPFIISLSSNVQHFQDIIAVYIGRNMYYSQHNVIIDKRVTRLQCKGITIDTSQRQKWTLNDYEKYVMHGFTLYFEKGLMDKYGALMHVLNVDLKVINHVIPCGALNVLHSTSIWLNDNYLYYDFAKETKDGRWCAIDVYKPPESMCFHPDAKWLISHGNMSNKAESVEIYRVKDWIKDRGFMPMVLLHELAHSYHWYLDFDRDDVLNAYNSAKNSEKRLYRNIPFVLGGKKDAYALTNAMEYFAELTESFFGLNDFYPFNKEELAQYDECGYNMMQTVWFFDHQEILRNRKMTLENRRRKQEPKKNDKKFQIDTSRLVSL